MEMREFKMSFRRKAVAVLALLAAVAAASPASAASVDQAFAAAVAKVLDGVHNDFLLRRAERFGEAPPSSLAHRG